MILIMEKTLNESCKLINYKTAEVSVKSCIYEIIF